jgi:CDP-glucose 4,6-dehydratase
VRGDVRDTRLLREALAERDVELVFHLAGQAIVGGAGQAPGETFAVNVGGTWSVLEACREAGCPRVVVASSEKVYGPEPVGRLTERSPLEPGDSYAASKAAADVIARSYWAAHGLRVAVARLGNVYGGGDMNPSRLVPEAVWAALAGRAPRIRSDGTARRDFLYVEDAVAAYLAIADLLAVDSDRSAGLAFNAGAGIRATVLELVSGVFAAAGVPLHRELRGAGSIAGRRDADPSAGGSDHSLLSGLTGWRPRVELEEGLRRTVAWYREHAPSPPPSAGRPTP